VFQVNDILFNGLKENDTDFFIQFRKNDISGKNRRIAQAFSIVRQAK